MSSAAFTSVACLEPSIGQPEIISALSFALDLTEGATPGHALRCCLMGLRLAGELELAEELLQPLYYALLLKDIGCSSNAARMTQLVGGDDRAVKSVAKLTDWTHVYRADVRALKMLWRSVLPDESSARRVARMIALAARQRQNNCEMINLRCERGAMILRKLQMGDLAAEAVRHLDEHWDGSGYPEQTRGSDIPVLARICSVAQTLDVFAMADGLDAAIEVLRRRSGAWFDPDIVAAAERLHGTGKLWTYCRPDCSVEVSRGAVMAMHPGERHDLGPEQIDAICEAFADVVDAKSPFTFSHSLSVTAMAVTLATEMNLTQDRIRLVRRAALLHDLGKLGVPNTILDKNGKLTPQERAIVEEHPFLTRSILERLPAFSEVAKIAGEHHEKLDGTGYPLGLKADAMCVESRLLVVADCFVALAEDRPYRKGMQLAEILALLGSDVPAKLDAASFAALEAVVARWDGQVPAALRKPPAYAACELYPKGTRTLVAAAEPLQRSSPQGSGARHQEE